jgi:hypothetical protein
VFVLLLVQAGTILLATLGELLFMGGLPFYLIMPVVRITLLLVFGALALRGSKTGLIWLIVLQAFSLGGFLLSLGLGWLPQLDFTPNLTGLFTSLVLPIVVIVYCVQLLLVRRAPVFPAPAGAVAPAAVGVSGAAGIAGVSGVAA